MRGFFIACGSSPNILLGLYKHLEVPASVLDTNQLSTGDTLYPSYSLEEEPDTELHPRMQRTDR